MSDDIRIRRASPAEIDTIISIDDDACASYEQAGLHFDIGPDHPFAVAEHDHWLQAARRDSVFFAEDADGRAVGLLVMDRADGIASLEQLSVRMNAQRRGVGRRLLERAVVWAPGEDLWLTTYAHLPWNRPFYERHGFVAVPEAACPPDVVASLVEQRRWLPAPEQRIAMRRPVG